MTPLRNKIQNQIRQAAGNLLRNRRLVRAPILIYRAGLGAVFGRRLLMLQHQGRNTGARRYVVLEVIDNPSPNQYVVASGFGHHAQWYRNIKHNPDVHVTVGSRHARPGTATTLDHEQTRRVLQRYATHHPRSWEQLKPIFEDALGSPIDADRTDLPLVLLTLEAEPA